MSAAVTGVVAVAPVTRRVRAYFAPVDRAAGVPTIFDPAQMAAFSLDTPPAPWVDLGWITKFARKCGTTVEALRAGTPAVVQAQVRSEIEATVSFEFESWGRLQATLAAGSQQTNLLTTAVGAATNGSGGVALAAVALSSTGAVSTSTSLNVGVVAVETFAVGGLVAVDIDYTGQVGYVGTGVSGAYVASAAAVGDDANFIRRVTLNVGVISAIADGVLQLASPLQAGTPTAGMRVSRMVGYCDREGASFFHEWSALFVMEGVQGDRIYYHYPRLQAMQGASEAMSEVSTSFEKIRLAGGFRAFPVRDANDGETVVCFRSYVPALMRLS